MFANDIMDHLKQRPFVPFRIVTQVDKHYDVWHPDGAMVSLTSTYVGDRAKEGEPFGKIHVINNQAIIRLEPLTVEASR